MRRARNGLDLFHVRVLDTLLREQNISRAAEALHMSQPALSKTLARLREHFDDQLFVRVAFQMKPTAKSLGLATRVKNILEQMSLLESEEHPFSPKTSSRHFKFAAPDIAVIVMLPPILREMRRQAPEVRLSTIELDGEHLREWLESGKVDLAAGDYPFLVQGIKRQRLLVTHHVSLVEKRHPRLAELSSANAFVEQQHVLVNRSEILSYGPPAEEALELAIPRKRVTATVPSFAAAALLAKYTDSIVTLPKPIAAILARELDLKFFKTPIKLPDTEVYQYWHERYDRDHGHEWLRALFHQQCARIA